MNATTHSSQIPAYELNQRELTPNPGETNLSYGITCFQYDGLGTRHTVETLYDVSIHKEFVGAMVDLFNLCELPPDRFKRTVIDLIP